MKKILFALLAIAAFVPIHAQELDCSVTINTPKLQTTDPKVFATLKTAVEEFMNNTKWTDDVFEQTERIKINFNITITQELSATSFGAEMAIQATRPVYGSDYETPILNHMDKDIKFSYQQFQPLQYSKNAYIDNLSSLLSFYAYLTLGLDYDSFAPYGGEQYFQAAQEIVNIIPQAGDFTSGWKSTDKGQRNRYYMVENTLNPRLKPLRQSMYEYHRKGLDFAYQNPAQARTTLVQALGDAEKIATSYLNSMVIQMFVNAKSLEIIEIFKMGDAAQKQRVNQIMTKLDPSNASKYRDIGF